MPALSYKTCPQSVSSHAFSKATLKTTQLSYRLLQPFWPPRILPMAQWRSFLMRPLSHHYRTNSCLNVKDINGAQGTTFADMILAT